MTTSPAEHTTPEPERAAVESDAAESTPGPERQSLAESMLADGSIVKSATGEGYVAKYYAPPPLPDDFRYGPYPLAPYDADEAPTCDADDGEPPKYNPDLYRVDKVTWWALYEKYEAAVLAHEDAQDARDAMNSLRASLSVKFNEGDICDIAKSLNDNERYDAFQLVQEVHARVYANPNMAKVRQDFEAIEGFDFDPVGAKSRSPYWWHDVELSELLEEPEPEYEWLIPGLLERGDRVMLTGQEGKGKSTLLRQFGIQCASGIHPFTLEPMPPLDVLMIDLENPRRLYKRKMKHLRILAGERYKGGFRTVMRPEGLNLQNRTDVQHLDELISNSRPDIVIIGPHYKMMDDDGKGQDKPAGDAARVLDVLRERYDFALLIEAHSPHAGMDGKVNKRPFGSSLWKRWPEFGIYLSPEGLLEHWRGARDERDWPIALQRGGDHWPWTVSKAKEAASTKKEILWSQIVELGPLSYRDLAKELETNVSNIQRVIKAHQDEWTKMKDEYQQMQLGES